MKVPFFRPDIPNESIEEVKKTIESGWLTRGEKTQQFEAKFVKYVNSRFALGVNSGTSALHASLVALQIKPKDEVITTAMTWPATVNAIEYVGATPVFADIDKESLNIRIDDVKAKVTKRTKAVIPVDLYGNPCGIQAIIDFAEEKELFVVEDAAHAIEAKENGKKVGNRATLTCFSFYANKNLTTGEGGMITTQDEDIYKKIKMLCSSGISLDAWSKHTLDLSSRRVTVFPGFKYNMFDLQAALGLHQIPLIESRWRKRDEKYSIYRDLLSEIREIELIKHDLPPNSKHGHYLLAISLNLDIIKASQLDIIQELVKRDISTGIHYYPVHLHPYYRKYPADLPITDHYSERMVSLPFFPSIHEEEIHYVVGSLKEIVSG
jgi:dTDP-4-amino-4,6-dideoxygalactose transaminase